MQVKNKKTGDNNKEAKTVKLNRSADDWQRLIMDAKKKETNWKFLREDAGDESSEREDES